MRRATLLTQPMGEYDRVSYVRAPFGILIITVDMDHPYIQEYLVNARNANTKDTILVRSPLVTVMVYDDGEYEFNPTVDPDLNRKMCEWSTLPLKNVGSVTVSDLTSLEGFRAPVIHVLTGYKVHHAYEDHLNFYKDGKLIAIHMKSEEWPKAFRHIEADLVLVEPEWYTRARVYYPTCRVINDPRYPCVVDMSLLEHRMFPTRYVKNSRTVMHSLVRTREVFYQGKMVTYDEFPKDLLLEMVHPLDKLYHLLTCTKIPFNVLYEYYKKM
jgi:hypothetical protein